MAARDAETDRPLQGEAEVATLIVGLSVYTLFLSVVGSLYRIDQSIVLIGLVSGLFASVVAGWMMTPVRPWLTIMWLPIATVFLAVPILSSFVPPYGWDEAAYAATLPKYFSTAHRLFYASDVSIYSAFPASYEALTTASMLLTGSVSPMRLLGVACFALMGGVAVILSYGLIGRVSVSLLAGCLVVGGGVGTFASHIKNDFVNGALQASAILFLFAYLRRPSLVMAALSGMTLGLSGGTKYNSLQFVLCAIVCILPLAWRVAPTALRWRHAAAFCLTGIVFGTFWYGRNFLLFGNPIYPFANSLFAEPTDAARLFSAVVSEMFYGYSGFSFASAPSRVFSALLVDQFGVCVLVLTSIGLIIGIRRAITVDQDRYPLIFLISITIIYSVTCLLFGLWAARYFVVLLVCYAVMAALTLEWLLLRLSRVAFLQPAPRTLAACVIGCVLAGTTLQRQWRETSWLVNSTLAGTGKKKFASLTVNYWQVAQWINNNMPACARVGIGIDVQPLFYIERSLYNFSPLSEDFLDTLTADAYGKRFRELGITHIAIQDWLGVQLYPEARNPNMYRFINNLYSSMKLLQDNGEVRLIGEAPGLAGRTVRFYEFSADAAKAEAQCQGHRIWRAGSDARAP